MEEGELKRREAEAIAELAATARYHAGRLPPRSRWARPLSRIAGSLSARPGPGSPPARSAGGAGGHLQLVGGERRTPEEDRGG